MTKEYEEKVRKADQKHQEDLEFYDEVELPQYERECRLTPEGKVSLVADKIFTGFRGSTHSHL